MKTYLTLILILMAGVALGQVDQAKVNKFYNKGQRLQTAGKHTESLANFLKVIELDPKDWKARTKVIQEYHAVGQLKERDKARTALLDLRKGGNLESLSKANLYCRDQFVSGDNKVMTLEYFDLQGEQALRYSFLVLDKAGKKTQFKISLGSYEFTNALARETGSLKKGERLFHLDGYFPGGEHRTYSFFQGEPKYDDVRKMVIEIIEGKRKKISGTKLTKEGAEIEFNPK